MKIIKYIIFGQEKMNENNLKKYDENNKNE